MRQIIESGDDEQIDSTVREHHFGGGFISNTFDRSYAVTEQRNYPSQQISQIKSQAKNERNKAPDLTF